MLALLALPAHAQQALPGNRFDVAETDLFLTGVSRGEGSGVLMLADQVPGSQETAQFVLPGVEALGVLSFPDRMLWEGDAPDRRFTEIAAGCVARLYFQANAQALAVFRVRLFDVHPDGTRDLLAQDEQQFVTALSATPVEFHLQTAGAVIDEHATLLMEVQAETTQALVLMQYGGATPSGLMGLKTRPLDTDGDGLADSDELLAGSNPLASDTFPGDGADRDGDGIPDQVETRLGTDPDVADTDGDGYLDGVELHAGSDPLDPSSTPRDEDGDGLPDSFEVAYFNTTNINGQPGQPGPPGAPGTDGALDPDGDGCNNLCEAAHGTDPTNPDTDGDGILDGDEVRQGTDPSSSLSFQGVSGVPEPVAAAAAFAIGTTLVLLPFLRRPTA